MMRGGQTQPFHNSKSWNSETGGNFYSFNGKVTENPSSQRFGTIEITPSVHNIAGKDVITKDLPSTQTGGKRHSKKLNKKRVHKIKTSKLHKKHRKARKMKGGSGGSTVCPSCPSTSSKVGPPAMSLGDIVPQTVKNIYRGAVDSVENTANALEGKPPIADDSDISNQPISKHITADPPKLNMPPNVGRIMSESEASVGRL
tara:strand:+ start:116 stop:718 length:603 start_codon:yes stop_codon:yes gene_type:complete